MARGLLTGGRGETEYSEDEDSDTEEYKSVKHLCVLSLIVSAWIVNTSFFFPHLDIELVLSACSSINPITGHVEEPMPNPIEEMTEEQKEYEGQNLVNLFDKLSR